jgi:hypothetical protein
MYAMGSGVGYNPPPANPYSMKMPIPATPADSYQPSSEQKRKKDNNAQLFLMAAGGIAAAVITGILCKKAFFPTKPSAKSTPAKSLDTSSVESYSSSIASVVQQPVKRTKISGTPISTGVGKRFAIDILGLERFIQHPATLIRHPSSWKANRSWMGNISKCEDPNYVSPALKRTLSKITAKDTLALTAHGNTKEIACFNPKQLADFLKRHGLKEVNTLKLKSCSVGIKLEKNSFLESLSKELTKNEISHKAIQGYEGLYNPAYKVVFLRKPNGKYHNFRSVRASKATRTVYQKQV